MRSARKRQSSSCTRERRGVFAVNGDDGYPYAVPVNFFYDEEANRIYFHGSRAGHKIDSVRKSDKVCFTVYGQRDDPGRSLGAVYAERVVFGRCRLPEYGEESMALLKRFAMKYYPEESMVDAEIADAGKAAQMYVIDIEHISGKEVQEK